MPLEIIDAAKATRQRKGNRFAGWGRRDGENRVEPLAKPAFAAPFALVPGEPIFTIGSCFARNIESELIRRGYAVPMVELFRDGPLAGQNPGIINNFGTPSILNELGWAFGAIPFREEMAFVETKGGFVDLHLRTDLRPEPLEVVRARRQAIFAATRTLARCRVMILTLGLTEVWHDDIHGLYLNQTPRPSVARADPARFSLHALDFAETLDHLDRALAIAFAHGHPDLRIILSVSPVPMAATHRAMDVIVANAASKATLRCVAEHVVARDPRIVYFPSYESVTLSDREIAWEADLVHVRPEIVALNVARMIAAYCPDAPPGDTEGEAALVERAERARRAGDAAFFAAHAAQSRVSEAFAVEHARFLEAQGHHGEAAALLTEAKDTAARVLHARLVRRAGDAERATALLAPLCEGDSGAREAWQEQLAALLDIGDLAAAIAFRDRWVKVQPRSEIRADRMIASHLRDQGDRAGSVARLEHAMGAPRGDRAGAMLELGEDYAALGRFDRAWAIAAHVEIGTAMQARRLRRLETTLTASGAVRPDAVAPLVFPVRGAAAGRKSWRKRLRRVWKMLRTRLDLS